MSTPHQIGDDRELDRGRGGEVGVGVLAAPACPRVAVGQLHADLPRLVGDVALHLADPVLHGAGERVGRRARTSPPGPAGVSGGSGAARTLRASAMLTVMLNRRSCWRGRACTPPRPAARPQLSQARPLVGPPDLGVDCRIPVLHPLSCVTT